MFRVSWCRICWVKGAGFTDLNCQLSVQRSHEFTAEENQDEILHTLTAHTYVYIYVYMCFIYIYVQIKLHGYVYTYVCIYIYIYMYLHVYM